MVTQSIIRGNGSCSGQLAHLWRSIFGRARPAPSTAVALPEITSRVIVDGNDEQAQLVQRYLDLGRAALLLRPMIAQTISAPHLTAVQEVILQEMAWCAEGDVLVTGGLSDGEQMGCPPTQLEHVFPFFLDRFPVTNGRYREFVAHGGYAQESVWDTTVWARVAEFVDRTGAPGPRYWSHGQFPPESADCPVVGISWFEADAYARWTGKRLPTDPEWVKVASCPAVTTTSLVQRRFPWGDVWDPAHGNLWISGLARPCSVNQFKEGDSAAGVRQLVGNVWEWTSTDLRATAFGKELKFDGPLKSLKGGAFDTYFENQATCQLQSADAPIARRHNVGFRCALSAADIVALEQKT